MGGLLAVYKAQAVPSIPEIFPSPPASGEILDMVRIGFWRIADPHRGLPRARQGGHFAIFGELLSFM